MTTMKQLLTRHLVAALTLSASAAYAGNVGVDLNFHLGGQPRPVVVQEQVYSPPAHECRTDQDIQFIYPESLGFYVATDVPYDLFYLQNRYYLFSNGIWRMSSGSRGPWLTVRQWDLPPAMRRQRIERIRAYRNAELVSYNRDREHYRGRRFFADREEWRAQRRDEREQWREQRRDERERWNDEQRGERWEHRQQRGGNRYD